MASSKNYTEVLIGGKVFTLSGFESEDYLQKVDVYKRQARKIGNGVAEAIDLVYKTK